MKELLKLYAERLPHPIGKFIGKLPMGYRLGRSYDFYRKAIKFQAKGAVSNRPIEQIFLLIDHFMVNQLAYAHFLEANGIDYQSLRDKCDFDSIPIVTKELLQTYELHQRSCEKYALKKSNTGGTTGQPLEFYLDKNAYSIEWAHMHAIWATLGYKYTDEKLTIRGKNIGNRYYKYNFNQNEYLLNAYTSVEENIEACKKLIVGRDIKWIHGYPSSIYSFLVELEATDSLLFEILIKKVKGVFLGSEYPAPQYRKYIEKHCGLKTISWYGHSEMAILAPEREPGSGVYYPFGSYGYTEAIKSGDSYRLVGTSLYNRATPFIRYDTGDLIKPTFKNGVLECFEIKEGRSSDNVIDKMGRFISLTALIFGRHHKAFGLCDHVQVRQPAEGIIELIITSSKENVDWADLFDFENTEFEVLYKQVNKPITTPNGKVKLLVEQK